MALLHDREKHKVAHNVIDRSGQTFNYWSIIKYSHTDGKRRHYLCRCKCGTEQVRSVRGITNGNIKSCGCIKASTRITHRKSKTTIHNIWCGMKARCYNPNNDKWKWYGGRGIRVCKRWLNSFENFYKDVGDPPSKYHTLDRFPDQNGDYKPSNVRWATKKEQCENRTSNVLITINGDVKNLTQWCEIYNRDYFVVWARIKRGATSISALTKPTTKSFLDATRN